MAAESGRPMMSSILAEVDSRFLAYYLMQFVQNPMELRAFMWLSSASWQGPADFVGT